MHKPPRTLALLVVALGSLSYAVEKQYGPLAVDYAGLISQHDVVYLSPPMQGYEGLILGDGEAGARIWNPPDRLMIQVNHSSFWNDSFPDPANDHGARIEIQTGLPLFDWKYLEDYEFRLRLFQADVMLRAKGSLGAADVAAFYSHPHKVMVIEYGDQSRVRTARRVLLERFGSQYFGSFGRRDQNPELNLEGTETGTEPGELCVQQQLGSLRFAVVLRLAGADTAPTVTRLNRHQVEAVWLPAGKAAFRMYLAMAHTSETPDPLGLARQRIRKAIEDGIEKVRAEHRSDWAEQWPRSFLHIPEDRYVENLWYLVMYQNIASRRGAEPPYFIDSIWNWKRDVKAWQSAYLHWNMFSGNFPLFAAGRLDLFEPYFHWKERQLPHAIALAKQAHGVDGAAFTDFATFRGEQKHKVGNMVWNLSHGPQIAMEFYQYWQYSRDDEFLKKRAPPFLREVSRFYFNYLERDANGAYHVPRSVPYEFHGRYQFRDCITDLAHLRWLLPALMDAEKRTGSVSELSAKAAEVLQNLAGFVPSPIHDHWLTTDQEGRKVYANPFFRGEPHSDSDRVWATGYSLKDKRFVSHMEVGRDPSTRYGVFGAAPTSLVFPPYLVGIDSSPQRRNYTGRNSKEDIAEWEAMRNGLRTIRKFPPGLPSDQTRHSDPDISWTGHSLDLPAFARLGLAENLRTAMRIYIGNYQMYPMGMWCYWGWQAWKDAWHYRKGSDGSVIKFPDDPRILHASTEPTGIFAVTAQEMLMTSPDGVVRVFPAYEKDAAFGLHAVGGFFVTSEQTGGAARYVRVFSRHGHQFVLSSPWPGQQIEVVEEASRKATAFQQDKDRIKFATEPGEAYWIHPKGAKLDPHRITDTPRDGPREFGGARLGKARDF